MRPVLTAAETQALDRETEARGTPVEALMERAGHAVARVAAGLAGGAYGKRAVIVCGKGNNGGDGLVAARWLSTWGMGVTVVLLAEPAAFRGPAAMNLRRVTDAGARVLATIVSHGRLDDAAAHLTAILGRELARADVAVDAIFGTGFKGLAEGAHAVAIDALNADGAPVVAVDVPSGVEGDTGLVRGPAVRAIATVTFGAPKVGDVLQPGAAHAGRLHVADIGFPPDLVRGELQMIEPADVRARWPHRGVADHKRRSGVVLVVAGSRRMTGAARLVARGAQRAGAGLVTVAAAEGALPQIQAGLEEATFLPLPEGPEGSASEAGWEALHERLMDAGAVACGPGLSTDGETPALVRRLVRESPIPVVVDADALNAFAGRAGELAERASEVVLTPHAGEFARLFGMPVEELLEDRVGFARKAAAETRAVVVLKGPGTLIALPDGEVRVNPTGSPALATGGTGDVLAGAIAALLARGLTPADAAICAVYVHGVAGELLDEGAVAGEVAEMLPLAIAEVTG